MRNHILNTNFFKYYVESAMFESDTVDVHPPGKSLMIQLYCFFSRFDENRRTDLKESVSDKRLRNSHILLCFTMFLTK